MRYLKVAGAALNQTPLDWRGNRERILEAIALARREGVQVLCLPELCISGYGCEDAFHGEAVAEQALDSLRAILPETGGIAVSVGLPLLHEQRLYNCAALLVDTQLAGFSAKQVLAGYGVYYEPRWFQPWPSGTAAHHPWDGAPTEGGNGGGAGNTVPIGDLVFDLGGVGLAFEICEDAWARGASAGRGSGPSGGSGSGGSGSGGVDLLLNPSASHFAFDKHEVVRGIVQEGSRQAHAAYVYANLLGNEAGRLLFDGTVLVASDGKVLAENPRFSYRTVNLVTATVDLRGNRLERRRTACPAPNRATPGRTVVPVDFRPLEASPVRTGVTAPRGPSSTRPAAPFAPTERHEQFASAVALGLWDYLRKSRSQGFAVSLSGGVDSSTVAVLCWIMARRAVAELGADGVSRALAHVADLPGRSASGENGAGLGRRLLQRLLLTVYQASANSGDVTRSAAQEVAAAIGARHLELDIQPLVEQYEALAERALGRGLTWEDDDIARQNIQARVRSPGIWLLTNLEQRLLLCTSNRSEVGVGYATMDGDTSGGLAPIAGANKTFLRGWLRWMEAQGPADLEPLPALAAVNAQQPTAELRPPQQEQADERDLMPYPLLDAIEQAAIRDRMSPLEVWRLICAAPPEGYPLEPRQAADYVARFFRLWSRTQWKRERLAPSFHLDDENLDPRTWCRFPILTGGYETELEALQDVVDAAEAAT